MEQDNFKVTVCVLSMDNANKCECSKDENISFANYGSDNIVIEIGTKAYSVGLTQFEQIVKMATEVRKAREDKLYEAQVILTRVKACIGLGCQNKLGVKDDKIIFKQDEKY